MLSHLDGQYLLEAESWINQAIEADIRNRTSWSLAMDYLSYADLLTKKGDRQKAVENLGKAIETFKECGSDGWVEKAEGGRHRTAGHLSDRAADGRRAAGNAGPLALEGRTLSGDRRLR
jgi:tetratricopeptide (TPR) repeat protein